MEQSLDNFEERLKKATLDPKSAIEVAGELCRDYLGVAHEKQDDLRVLVNRMKATMKDENPKMSMTEIKMRVEGTDTYREYLKWEHWVQRCEQMIMIAKQHSRISGQY